VSGGEFAVNPPIEDGKTRNVLPLKREISARGLNEKRLEVIHEPRIAGAPPQDHRGDKTPEFARWLIANRPKEAAEKYASIWSLNPNFPD
jgi:hypothetical protein